MTASIDARRRAEKESNVRPYPDAYIAYDDPYGDDAPIQSTSLTTGAWVMIGASWIIAWILIGAYVSDAIGSAPDARAQAQIARTN